MQPRRVALVCPYSWSTPGGVQTHVAGLAAVLRRRGLDVDVLAPADGPADVIPLGRTVGIPDNGSVTRLALTPMSVARTARLLRAGGYDLVHAHEPMLPSVSLTALYAAEVPVVGTFHMLGASDRWYRLFAPLVRHAARRLSGRIAVSEPARRFAARWVSGHYHVIPNAVDVAAYETGRSGRNGRRVLFVGRPDRRKGLPVLLRAFASLPEDATLELAGVRDREADALADGLPRGVMRRVRAHGRVSDFDRRRLLADADVLCVPSLGGESFGLVVVEGMAAGLPVVASDIPGYRAVLPQVCGTLVPPGDHRALAAALEELLRDESLRFRLGAAARQRAQRFDWPLVADRVLAVYGEALAGERAGATRPFRGGIDGARGEPEGAPGGGLRG